MENRIIETDEAGVETATYVCSDGDSRIDIIVSPFLATPQQIQSIYISIAVLIQTQTRYLYAT